MISYMTEYIKLRGIVWHVLQNITGEYVYELKCDAGLLDYAFDSFEKAVPMPDATNGEEMNLYLHMLAWAMFEQGVFAANLVFRHERTLFVIPTEVLNEELNEYYSKGFMRRTLELLEGGSREVTEEQLVTVIDEYIERAAKQPYIDLANHEHLECFAAAAFTAGTSVYMQLQKRDDRFYYLLNEFQAF